MATLECDKVIYRRSYFVFDPEDVRSNGGFIYRLINSTSATVPNVDGDPVTLLSTDIAALADPIFWSGLLIVLTLVLLVATLFVQCCVCCWSSAHKDDQKPIGCKAFCGILSCIPVFLVIGCLAVIIWSEFTMDTGVQAHRSNLYSFVNGTVPVQDVVVAIQDLILRLFFSFQLYRHWVSIAFCIMTILIMLSTFLAIICCTPLTKSSTAVVMFLSINWFWTIVMSLISGVTFFSLFFLSTICYDMYNIGGTARCTDPNLLQDALSLQSFCSTDVFIPHLVTVSMYFGLLLFLVLWQLFGVCYAASFSGGYVDEEVGNEQEGEHEEEDMEMVTTTTTTVTQYVRPVPTGAPRPPAQPMFFVPSPNNFQPVYNPAVNTLTRTPQNAASADVAPSQPEESAQEAEMNPSSTDVPASAPPQYDESWTERQNSL
ncbi:uncharacterized protein LOC135343262 [Halichondria panicea]|uniref:uncharacterized protein LOC135343262 n=1 Tax=Halichondria panicea TaxID=6063 RepID=UPI00312B67F2